MRHRVLSEERGATALLVAACLLLLVGFAAIAVDAGAGFNSRRQNQTSADLAAVAGALTYVSPSPATNARDTVFSYVKDNLDVSYSAAEWQTLWSTCADPAKPVGFNPVPAPAGWAVTTIDCISGSTEEVRVRIPDQLVDTSFGRVVGLNQLRTSAVAHASIEMRPGGFVRPFGVLNNLPNGSTCLTSSPSGLAAPPCDGPDSGNFGTLNSQTWGPPYSDDSITDCGTPGNDELAQNIANGIDHFIGMAPTFAGSGGAYGVFPSNTTRLDECVMSGSQAIASDNTPVAGPVNTMRADTGFNLFQATKAGLIAGQAADFPNATSTVTPLLQQSGGASYRNLKERVSGTPYTYSVDNTPLWYHLLTDAQMTSAGIHVQVQAECAREVVAAAADKRQAIDDCFDEFDKHVKKPIFADTLDDGPRFGYAPEFHFTTWGSGNHWQPIKSYRMLYLDTIWFNCNDKYDPTKNDAPCDGTKGLVFEPVGTADESDMQVGNGGNMRQLRLDQISAFLIPTDAVSQKILAAFPGNVRGPFNVRLTR